MIESYRDLVAWQKAMNLVVDIYAVTGLLPDSEKFGLASQLRRAAVSVPSMLAEGYARSGTKELARYVSMAMGSLAEIETQLLIAMRLRYFEDQALAPLLDSCNEVGRILRGLKKVLVSSLATPSRITP